MNAAPALGALLGRLVRSAASLAAEGFDPSAAGRVTRAVLQIANPRSPFAPAVFGAVLAVVLALVWAEFDRRRAASASQIFRLPGSETAAPLPVPKPLRYAPPR